MDERCFSLLREWDGNGVVVRHDQPTGTWIFIALHNDTLGPAVGGSRMKVYPELSDALLDAMRLAEGMTCKWAGIGIPHGGAKAVLAIPRPLDKSAKEGLLLRYGALVETLQGSFSTGADLGTGPEDIAVMARQTHHVAGVNFSDGSTTDPGPFTAHGVFAGLVAAVEHVFGGRDLARHTILVEGLGGVGLPLAHSLSKGGARLLLADLDEAKAAATAGDLGGEVVPLAEVPQTVCDVYAPCAVGATLNAATIPRLACRIVAGSANNQLRDAEDADRLHQRGIVYVPDYIINAGGAMALIGLNDEPDREVIFGRVAGIGATVSSLLREASDNGESPIAAARRRVERVLASGPS